MPNLTIHVQKDLLFVIIMFANYFNIVSNKIYRVKPNTKLPNKIEVTASLHFLNKCCKKDNNSN